MKRLGIPTMFRNQDRNILFGKPIFYLPCWIFFIQNHFSGLSCQIFLPVSSCRVINAIIHTYEIKIGKQTHVWQKNPPHTFLHSLSFTDHKFKSYLSRCKLILTFPTFLLLLPIDICFELFTKKIHFLNTYLVFFNIIR